jgi:hypothetical protein
VTQQDPNVTYTPEGEQVVLEPGDEGYVEPNAPEGEPTVLDPQPMPAEGEPLPPTPPGEDLRLVNEAGQSESEAILLARGTVVESTSPTDIVPNTPQIRPFPVEAVPVQEEEVPPEEPLEEPLEAPVEAPEQTDTSASALIARARAATTDEELDEIEALANERVTVLDAVEARREELGA